eukprot:TRINITY_DN437_c0_g2_i1.p1 TRINITY_DN437_c0_g2~~TRINITY_DN437_c0_g2_i1.p1  ORF type:complete len:579 (+),score=111.67 TRINITY_DN437_c0_g2_i1:58-1794(+)
MALRVQQAFPLQVFVVTSFLFVASSSASGGFLQHDATSRFHIGDAEFQHAMEAIMGCGSADGTDGASRDLASVQRTLEPMWRVAPKNDDGRVEWRMVRYLAHRYFMKTSSLLIRGLEPARQVNDSHAGAADILSNRVPSLVDVLEGKRSSRGFSLEDTVALIATLEQVIFDSESSLLETAYKRHGRTITSSISHEELNHVLITYMINWMIPDDSKTVDILLSKPSLLKEAIPQWESIKHLVEGLAKGMEFSRKLNPRPGQGTNTMEQRYSFQDAHEAVASITKTFASFWEAECQSIKTSLVALDKSGTGRIALSDFYAANAAGEWRFGESEAYLRELGALDETSPRDKYVVIPNYLLGANNCIVTNSHYFVCCVNECEEVLNDIEESVGSSVASPEDIMRPLANMTNFDDEPLKITAAMKTQLERIAETHGGKVPVHGRLFAQWLHYLMPRECPFPHRAGMHSAQAPLEYGTNYLASAGEVEVHASRGRTEATGMAEELDEAQWMSQWSEDEELIADYSMQLRAPWESYRPSSITGIALLLLVALAVGAASQRVEKQPQFGSSGAGILFESSHKAHYV